LVEIKGLEKFAPKDYPGHISSTVFIGGCNFSCPFCDNPDLVRDQDGVPSIPLDYFLGFLDSRKGWLDGVCVTGGEPLVHDDLEDFLLLIRERGLNIKIDTNGSFPERLRSLIHKKSVDQIAMDVKAPFDKYNKACGKNVDIDTIQESIELIKTCGLPYMFRTTLVPGLIGREDLLRICEIIQGASLFQLQQFQPVRTLDPAYSKITPYTKEEIEDLASLARPFFSDVRIEGV
jgi:pyruvate formate lyase activating enzyme